MKKVMTIEEAFQTKGLTRPMLQDLAFYPEQYRPKQLATYEARVVVQAINDGWKADYSDWKQRKWYPVCYQEEGTADLSGFRFAGAGFVSTVTIGGGGSHLVFKSEEAAIHYAENFLELIWRIQVGE